MVRGHHQSMDGSGSVDFDRRELGVLGFAGYERSGVEFAKLRRRGGRHGGECVVDVGGGGRVRKDGVRPRGVVGGGVWVVPSGRGVECGGVGEEEFG